MSPSVDISKLVLRVVSFGPEKNQANKKPPPLIRYGRGGHRFVHLNVKEGLGMFSFHVHLFWKAAKIFTTPVSEEVIRQRRPLHGHPLVSRKSTMYFKTCYWARNSIIKGIKHSFCADPFVFIQSCFSENHRRFLESCLEEGRMPTEEEIASLKSLSVLSK